MNRARRFRALAVWQVTLGVLLAGVLHTLPAQAQTSQKPNIVVVLADNLGYGELGVYGSGATRGAPTPRIDKLAVEGLRLTNMNMETQCTPSRSLSKTTPFRSDRSHLVRSPSSVRFLKAGAFAIQGILSIPLEKLMRSLGVSFARTDGGSGNDSHSVVGTAYLKMESPNIGFEWSRPSVCDEAAYSKAASGPVVLALAGLASPLNP